MLRRLFGRRVPDDDAVQVPPAVGVARSVAAVLGPTPRATPRRFLPAEGLDAHGPVLAITASGPITVRPGDARADGARALAGVAQLTVLHAGVLELRDSLGSRELLTAPARHLLAAGAGTNVELQPAKELQRDGGPLHLEQITWRTPEPAPARVSTDHALGPFGQGRARIHLLAGVAWEHRLDAELGLTVLRLVIPPGSTATVPLADGDPAVLVVTASTALVGPDLRRVPDGSVAVLGDEGSSLQVATLIEEGADVSALVVCGPRPEPFVWDGTLAAADDQALAAVQHAAASGDFGALPEPR
ncbi:MAG: hypothetical protein KY434_09510 [Actinobacteria bacterium]|nr:hypothetical protein [Actinomycetota bacterium]